MSTQTRGIIEIELRADRFTNPAKKAVSDFRTLETSGSTSMKNLGRSVDTATQSITSMSTRGKTGVREVTAALSDMSTQGKTSLTTLTQKMQALDGTAKSTGMAMRSLGTQGKTALSGLGLQAQSTTARMNNLANATNAARLANVAMISSAAGIAVSMVQLETSLTTMPKRINAMERAETALNRVQDLLATKTLTLERSQIKLDKARAKGTATARELEAMETKITNTTNELATARRDLSDKTVALTLKEADYYDTLKTFAAGTAMLFLQSGTLVFTMLTQMAMATDMTTGAFVKMKLAALANSNMLKLLRVDLHGASLALRGFSVSQTAIGTTSIIAATGINRVGLAVKGLYLALGPIGWAIIGITAVWTAWETNLFGFQDAVRETILWLQKMWETLKWIIPVIGLVDEAFKRFAPEQHAAAAHSLTDAISGIGKESELLAGTATDAGTAIGDMIPPLTGAGSAAGIAAGGMDAFNISLGVSAVAIPPLTQSIIDFYAILGKGDTLESFHDGMNSITTALTFATEKWGLMSHDGQAAINELKPSISQLVDEMNAVGDHALADNFIKSLQDMNVFGGKYLDGLSDKVHGLISNLENLKKNYDSVTSGGRSSGGFGPQGDTAASEHIYSNRITKNAPSGVHTQGGGGTPEYLAYMTQLHQTKYGNPDYQKAAKQPPHTGLKPISYYKAKSAPTIPRV